LDTVNPDIWVAPPSPETFTRPVPRCWKLVGPEITRPPTRERRARVGVVFWPRIRMKYRRTRNILRAIMIVMRTIIPTINPAGAG